MAAKLAIVILCIVCALDQTLGVSVSTRSASPDEARVTDSEDRGDSRSFYSKSRISPHRMMHFGKRPAGLSELNAGQRSIGKSPAHYPYSLYFDLAPSRVLEPVFDDGLIDQNGREQHLAELIESVLEERRKACSKKEKRVNQQPLADLSFGSSSSANNKQDAHYASDADAYKLVRLVDADGNYAYEILPPTSLFSIHGANNNRDKKQQSSRLVDGVANGNDYKEPQAASEDGATAVKQQENELAASNGGGEQQEQQAQQQEDSNISIVGRSASAASAGVPFQMTEAGDDLLSKYMQAQVVNKLLFGRPISIEQNGGSYRNLGNFMKKAEPQRMTFMHFG